MLYHRCRTRATHPTLTAGQPTGARPRPPRRAPTQLPTYSYFCSYRRAAHLYFARTSYHEWGALRRSDSGFRNAYRIMRLGAWQRALCTCGWTIAQVRRRCVRARVCISVTPARAVVSGIRGEFSPNTSLFLPACVFAPTLLRLNDSQENCGILRGPQGKKGRSVGIV